MKKAEQDALSRQHDAANLLAQIRGLQKPPTQEESLGFAWDRDTPAAKSAKPSAEPPSRTPLPPWREHQQHNTYARPPTTTSTGVHTVARPSLHPTTLGFVWGYQYDTHAAPVPTFAYASPSSIPRGPQFQCPARHAFPAAHTLPKPLDFQGTIKCNTCFRIARGTTARRIGESCVAWGCQGTMVVPDKNGRV